jgi:hypothetical protein
VSSAAVEPHMRCWRLDAAPRGYRLAVGTICRFIEGTPPRVVWDPDLKDFVSPTWTEVPDPREAGAA